MKTVAGLLMAFLSFPVMADQASYLTKLRGSVGRYRTLVGQDCAAAYYFPLRYVVAEKESSVALGKNVRTVGAGEEVSAVVRIQLVLRPETEAPTAAEIAEIAEWARREGPGCAGSEMKVERYPAAFIRTESLDALNRQSFKVISSSFDSRGVLTMNLEVDPSKTKAAQLIRELNFYDPEASVAMMSVEMEASVAIAMGYEILALFSDHHYTERVCTERESCWKVFGCKVRCKRRTYCADIPKVVQQLDNLAVKNQVSMDVQLVRGAPESRIEEAKQALMSRFVVSNYREVSRTNLDGVATITVGEMRKEARDTYRDEEVVERLEQIDVRENLSIREVGDAISAQLTKAYADLAPKKNGRR